MENKLNERILRREIEAKLRDAFSVLEKDNVLFFKTLKQFSFLFPKENEFPAIGAVGYNQKTKKVLLLLREDAVLKSNVFCLAGLLEHECAHFLLEHLSRKSKLTNLSDQEFMLLNKAEDYLINASCPHISNRLDEIKRINSPLANGCFLPDLIEKYPELKGRDESNMSSIELFNFLREKGEAGQNNSSGDSESGEGSEDQEGGSGQGGGDSSKDGKGKGKAKLQKDGTTGDSFDSHDIQEIIEDDDGNEMLGGKIDKNKTAEEMNDIQSDIDSKIKDALDKTIKDLKREGQLDKAIGQLRGDIRAKIYDMVRSKTDKTVVLNFYTSLCIGFKKTWSSLHRRYPYLQKGKRDLKKPKILMALDSSGSMGSDELWGMIAYQLKNLSMKCEKFTIVIGDTELQHVVEIKNKNDFDKDKVVFAGGGGTCMQWVFDYASENDYDGVILHTDGHFSHVDTKNIKSIFFLYGNYVDENHPYTKVVRVYPD